MKNYILRIDKLSVEVIAGFLDNGTPKIPWSKKLQDIRKTSLQKLQDFRTTSLRKSRGLEKLRDFRTMTLRKFRGLKKSRDFRTTSRLHKKSRGLKNRGIFGWWHSENPAVSNLCGVFGRQHSRKDLWDDAHIAWWMDTGEDTTLEAADADPTEQIVLNWCGNAELVGGHRLYNYSTTIWKAHCNQNLHDGNGKDMIAVWASGLTLYYYMF